MFAVTVSNSDPHWDQRISSNLIRGYLCDSCENTAAVSLSVLFYFISSLNNYFSVLLSVLQKPKHPTERFVKIIHDDRSCIILYWIAWVGDGDTVGEVHNTGRMKWVKYKTHKPGALIWTNTHVCFVQRASLPHFTQPLLPLLWIQRGRLSWTWCARRPF